MVQMLKELDKINANFWKALVKGRRKFWAFTILIVLSTVIELKEAGEYFPWYYWLFCFLTFCGVNWLDKVKWFTGESFGKGKK